MDTTTAAVEDCCEVCLTTPRDARIAPVPRPLCSPCTSTEHDQEHHCTICRGAIQMMSCLYLRFQCSLEYWQFDYWHFINIIRIS